MQHKTLSAITVFLIIALLGCSQSRQFSIGSRLEKMGRYDDALSAYQAALSQAKDKDPKEQSQIYLRMGECLIRLNRIPQAFRAFDEAATLDGSNIAARLRVGEFLLSAGAADRAREQAEGVMRISPRNGEAFALWGAAMESLGNKE